jgi:hypothetical protein
VHTRHEIGARRVELLETSAVEDAALVELGPGGAVENEGLGANGVEKRGT